MRIGLVLNTSPSYSETFFQSKISGLKYQGFDVILFAENKASNFDLCQVKSPPKVSSFFGIQFIMLLWKFFQLGLTAPKQSYHFFCLERNSGRSLKETIKNIYLNSHILPEKLDWLHFGFATTALRSEHVAKAIRAKMGVSLRGYDIALYPLKHPECYRLLWHNVDKVHAISNDLLELAYQNGLNSEKPVKKITPAVDVSLYRRETPISTFHSPLKIFTVARLHWKKGLEYTLEALAILKKQGIPFRYTIIGAGEEYERLAFAAYQFGIQDWVSFKGKIPHDQVKSELENADIYLQYSIQEGFCNAVLEAQALGLLCVVSNAEGLSENIIHGRSGWVVPKRQPRLLAEQIKAILEMDEQYLLKIRTAAIERVRNEFNLEKQQQEFIKFYTEE